MPSQHHAGSMPRVTQPSTRALKCRYRTAPYSRAGDKGLVPSRKRGVDAHEHLLHRTM